jgi:hypothetical protein
MVLSTVGMTVEITVESQLSTTIGEGDLGTTVETPRVVICTATIPTTLTVGYGQGGQSGQRGHPPARSSDKHSCGEATDDAHTFTFMSPPLTWWEIIENGRSRFYDMLHSLAVTPYEAMTTQPHAVMLATL